MSEMGQLNQIKYRFQIFISIAIRIRSQLILISVCFLFQNCIENPNTLFKILPSDYTGVTFSNDLKENETFNIVEYLYYYNGGGVATGDINNDGLPDIYLTANQGENKLYLNQGNLKFKDITASAGVKGRGDWSTGVNMVDINGDGYLDIYVCNVGGYKGLKGKNELFINNQNNTFTEQASVYGLDFQGFSTQAAFFDYDRDGDLDCYLLNHSVHEAGNYGDTTLRKQRDYLAGDRLLRNDISRFNDASEEAGILGSKIGYGLGVAVADLNNDGWSDIYVSNDFHENDYLYYNNGDGTFREGIAESMGHSSNFSMGSDIADFNNDGLLDVMTLDMKPEDEVIYKSSGEADMYHIYTFKLGYGYLPQYPRNCLQLNQGQLLDSQTTQFSEVAQISGVDATDWSWSSLFADLDNDGLQDLYITNGILRRPNDLDWVEFYSNQQGKTTLEIAQQMPEGKAKNYAYQNVGNLQFKNQSNHWGLDKLGYSNGAAYADFDGDGDLDLVTNNINETASIFENTSNSLAERKTNFIKVRLKGVTPNSFGIGSIVKLYKKGQVQTQTQNPTRGFQSSVDYLLHFGLGTAERVDSVVIIWQNGQRQIQTNISVNQTLTFNQGEANQSTNYQVNNTTLFQPYTALDFRHIENDFNDFAVQKLMLQHLSTEGPKLAVGDVNSDGLEDVYVGGARDQAGQLFFQKKDGTFEAQTASRIFEGDKIAEDTDALFFDADSDGDLDLYVVSAGNEWRGQYKPLLDRLYINDGQGDFLKDEKALPEIYENGACIRAVDFDNDGDQDLFLGNRVITNGYGFIPNSYLLENNGKGQFTDVTKGVQGLDKVGMVTDAIWADYNLDKLPDLIVVGDWMPITIFKAKATDKGITFEKQENAFDQKTAGWWKSIQAADMDKDGDLDFIVGNHGLNCDLKASQTEPIELFANDYDGNQSLDHVFCYYNGGERYPFASKNELIKQMAGIKSQFVKNKDYVHKKIEDIFPKGQLQAAAKRQVYELQSAYVENLGNGQFKLHPLPVEAQTTPIYSILIQDFNKDGNLDVLLGGNLYGVVPKVGRYDASYGTLLQGDGKGGFTTVPTHQSGFTVKGQIRDIQLISTKNGQLILVTRNNDNIVSFQIAK